MKTHFRIAVAISFTLVTANTNAQASYDDEPVTAETFLRMEDGVKSMFAISPVKIENTNNGFAVRWQTVNENDIAFFELEAGDDKKNLSGIKKFEAGNQSHPANMYEVALNRSFLRSEKTYFRVKINFTNGKVSYTDIALVKMQKAK